MVQACRMQGVKGSRKLKFKDDTALADDGEEVLQELAWEFS